MNRRANQLDGSTWLRNSFSVWRGIARDTDFGEHPAAFPIDLAAKVIDCFVGDLNGSVLDPFAGAGSTLLAAVSRGMQAVGIDVNPEFRDLFLNRLAARGYGVSDTRYEVLDARNMYDVLAGTSFDLCFTSPPYWDIMRRPRTADRKASRPYSDLRSDLGNAGTYKEYIDALVRITSLVESVLKPKAYLVLNVMDIRKKHLFFPIHADIATRLPRESGFSLEDVVIWDRQADYHNMRPLGFPHKFIINRVHEYLLVFRKGA